jgi:hypothetical protein
VRADPHPAGHRAARAVSLLFLASALTVGCVEDGVNLPANYNNQRFRSIVIESTTPIVSDDVDDARNTMRALNGIHGSPRAIVDGDKSLKAYYWGRSALSDEHDGAHVSLVRLGTGTKCGTSLEGIYSGGTTGTPAPCLEDNKTENKPPEECSENFEFTFLDWHMDEIDDLNTAEVLWQAALAPDLGLGCNPGENGYQVRSPLTSAKANMLVRVAFNTLRHLRSDGVTGGFGDSQNPPKEYKRLRWVEFMDDPAAHMGYSVTGDSADGKTDYSILFDAYGAFAKLVKGEWQEPASDGRPVVAVGGISFTFTSPTELDIPLVIEDAHPMLRFIDHCAKNDFPLDFVSFKTRTRHPSEVAVIAQRIADFLVERGFTDTVLLPTSVDIDDATLTAQAAWVAQDQRLKSSYRGAFQSAARIYLQDVSGAPVANMIAGRGPRVLKDLLSHTGEPLEDLFSADLLTRSDYFAYFQGESNPDLDFFDDDNKLIDDIMPLPAFMNLFPFRQVSKHKRVLVKEGTDGEGMAVVASHDPASTDTLHVLIANANVTSGAAEIVYELELEDFVPSMVGHVEYKIATLDHNSFGVGSFHFSDTGIAETVEGTGNVRFVHEMAVPSVHYIQFVKPVCDANKGCGAGYSCSWVNGVGSSGFCIPIATPQ